MNSPEIRVLQVIARMNVGGPAWLVSVLTKGLTSEGFSTRLVCGEVSEDEADFLLRDPELPVQQIPLLGRPVTGGGDLKALLALRREIEAFRPHIVHTHTAKAGVLGRLAAMTERVPVRVHTFHGHLLHGYFSPGKTLAIRLTESVLARATTALIAVGERVRDELIAAGIGCVEQYAVIPPGVDHTVRPIDRGEARRRLGLPLEAPVALFVGRLTKVKRLDRLIAAMTLVLERESGAVLLIAGEGELFDAVRSSTAELGDSVRLLGWRDDLASLYAAADVAVISSDNEGMPVALMEAAAAGLPAVTTDVGSTGEVVEHGETGCVVDPTVAALADGLLSLLSDRHLRDRMGANARRRALELFGMDRLVTDHALLYRQLVSVKRSLS